ncbi:hypothetical protein [Labilibacter marinus]|uniref:hypothetical protein n=1 Tax=Labilibacter marinus TaxID=1477105 RepID=UPI0009500E2E|nr:hypothetical protein [Labilibacter marinus]
MKMFKFFAFLMAFAVVFTACSDDDGDKGPDEPLVEDGVYLIAAGSAVDAPSSKGKFTKASNENDMDTDRPSLMEIYMPIEGGTTFTIKEVSGASTMNYGSDDIAAVDKTAEGENADQPAENIWRGTLTDGGAEFSVAESGMYHIFLDKETMKVGFTKAEWGAIGSAWAEGWGSSVQFTEGTFGKEKMTWTIEEEPIKKSDWKFRYSNGWKVFLDYTTVTSDGKEGVAVNCNLGGALDALEAGADNIVNDEAGYFTLTLTWELGKGYSATIVKTGDLVNTDWTAVKWDAVGDGVSADNPTAEDDPTWTWGKVVLADNSGLPAKDQEMYTYTWTGIKLVKDAGFKVRAQDANASNAGFAQVDTENSSDKVADVDGNLSVTTEGTYDITLTIDADNSDTMVVTIVESQP